MNLKYYEKAENPVKSNNTKWIENIISTLIKSLVWYIEECG